MRCKIIIYPFPTREGTVGWYGNCIDACQLGTAPELTPAYGAYAPIFMSTADPNTCPTPGYIFCCPFVCTFIHKK